MVEDAPKYVEGYIQHRLKREHQILEVLRANPGATIEQMVDNIYAATTPPELLVAASLNVSHQLKKLFSQRRVKAVDDSGEPAGCVAIPVDEYISSAGGGMITAALQATKTAIPKESCDACEAAARAGAAQLQAMLSLKWFLVPAEEGSHL